ncbi:MAG: ferritin family protein [Candidatus Scalindua sp.]|nr:ferritin family protein [Candidatus Scalindua sp.]MDV5166959.1 ferritin family protein [Candidatus Scalindua sp.]
MDIYKYAMQMELDGRHFYLDLAKKTNNTGIKSILDLMAESEAKHYNIILDMQRGDKTQYSTDTEVLSKIKNVFEAMKEEKEEIDVDVSQIEFYKKALEVETKSEKFYLDRAEEEKDPHIKEIFLVLAKEEKSHCVLLENLVDLVSQPDTWVENPEWYHIDEN